AHNVVAAAYVDGSTIEGEVGFSNGDVVAGAKVEVFGSGHIKLLETVTDEDGQFRFEATRRIDHVIRINLGAGHIAELKVSADELPQSLPAGEGGATPETADERAQPNESVPDDKELEAMIQTAVANQVRPLQKQLLEYENKVRWHDILGGLGYILGLAGLGSYFLAKRKRSE
ncbi:MAG: carboxypeptidase regulatory-like domain-containing protein, partial [Rhodospirillales bacterium]|nr:carboxypeptidase regulatory-like domain-containing protein [Rhodospirillales bacterium]